MDAALYALLDSGTTVLTASRRFAHWLRASFANQAQASGRLVWPTPRVMPWATFLRDAVFRQREHQLNAPRLLRDLQAVALWERIVAASVDGQQLLNPIQAARGVARTWQRIHEYRVPLQSVAAYPTEEARAFTMWARTFQQYTQEHHWLDSARFSAWLADSEFVPATALALAGFDRFTPDIETLIAHWRTRGVDIFEVSAPANAGGAQVIAAKNADAELNLAARWARQQVEQGTRHIAIVVPQLNSRAAEVNRVFMRVFNPDAARVGAEQKPTAFVVAASPSLNTYPLVHHALLCLQLAQGQADTLLIGQLLRSPFMAGYAAEAAARAVADIAARKQRREHWDLNELHRFAAANNCPVLAAFMFSGSQLLHDQRNAALPSQWTERLRKLLQQAGWAQGRSLNSEEQQTRAKFYEVLAELSALDELLGEISFARAVAVVRDASQSERFAPESGDQPVMIIDDKTIAGMEFDALWVTGLHAGQWPPPIDPDPFLPIEIQRQYALPNATAAQCLRSAQRTLSRLVKSSNSVILSWPQLDEDAELQPSALLSNWSNATLATLPTASVPTFAQQLFSQRPVLESFLDHHAPALLATQVRGGSTIFALQSRCAFRAQAQLRLHAEAIPTVSLAIDPAQRGELTHRVLGEVWSTLKSSAGLRIAFGVGAAEHDAYSTALLNELRRHDGGDANALAVAGPLLAGYIRRIAVRVAQHIMPATTLHRQRLVALEVELAAQRIEALLKMELQRAPFVVQRAEEREAFKFAEMDIHIQLDRVDELQDGSTLLIDYKTGDANKIGDWLDIAYPGRPKAPQLPLYALAHRRKLAGISYAILAPGTAEFRGLANSAEIAAGIRDYANGKAYAKPVNVATWAELLAHWETVLKSLGKQFLDGEAWVDPLPGECTYCHLAGLCRVTELTGVRDEAVEEGADG